MFRILAILLLTSACVGDDTKDSDSAEDSDSATDSGPDFACGTEICTAGAQYCLSESGGAWEDTSDVPHCEALPAACAETLTCDCLRAQGSVPSGGECTEDGTGGLYVTVAYP